MAEVNFDCLEILGNHSVEYYLKGKSFFFLNDSKSSNFYYDRNCKEKTVSFNEQAKMLNFYLSAFKIDSTNPRNIVLKIRFNEENRILQIVDIFSNREGATTEKLCGSYLRSLKDFCYGNFTFLGKSTEVRVINSDIECFEGDLIGRKSLREIFLRKISSKNKMPDDLIGGLSFTLGEEVFYL